MNDDYDLEKNKKLFLHVVAERANGAIINVQRLGPNYGPGFVTEDGAVILNNFYLRADVDIPEYSEDRLIVVLYHELGHVKFLRTVKQHRADGVHAAFEHSLIECHRLAIDKKDKGPLNTALHYIDQRRQSENEPDHYQDALDRIVDSPLWKQCKALNEATD